MHISLIINKNKKKDTYKKRYQQKWTHSCQDRCEEGKQATQHIILNDGRKQCQSAGGSESNKERHHHCPHHVHHPLQHVLVIGWATGGQVQGGRGERMRGGEEGEQAEGCRPAVCREGEEQPCKRKGGERKRKVSDRERDEVEGDREEDGSQCSQAADNHQAQHKYDNDHSLPFAPLALLLHHSTPLLILSPHNHCYPSSISFTNFLSFLSFYLHPFFLLLLLSPSSSLLQVGFNLQFQKRLCFNTRAPSSSRWLSPIILSNSPLASMTPSFSTPTFIFISLFLFSFSQT